MKKNQHFSLKEYYLGKYLVIRMVNDQNNEYIDIIPERGAMVHDIGFSFTTGLASVVAGYKTADELEQDAGIMFRGSKLFPFPNRIKDGKYTFGGKEYQLPINFPHEGNSIHGLLYDKPFKFEGFFQEDTFGEMHFSYSADELYEGYPFKYELQVFYKLDAFSNLTIQTKVKNTGEKTMPVGDGWHVYFNTGSSIDQLQLTLNSESRYELDRNLCATGISEPYTVFNEAKKIGDKSFDHCFKLNEKKEVLLHDTRLGRKFRIWVRNQKPGYQFIQVYTPADRASIAIEPISCISNAFNNGIGLISLESGDDIDLQWGVQKVS